MGLLLGGISGSSAETVFAPTELGRQASTDAFSQRVVWATATEFSVNPADSEAEVDIWIETDAGETYIRVESYADGDTSTVEQWYNTGGTGQGAPGTDEDIMTLGERVDSINIYTRTFNSGLNVTHQQQWASFTDDDKTTFFVPTNGSKYGYRLRASVVTSSSAAAASNNWLQFTCRKAGYTDLTFLYRGEISASAEAF